MKNILLLVHDDGGQEARLQVALDLVRGLDGHLSCLEVIEMPALIGSDSFAEAMLLEEEHRREDANRERLTARLAHEGISWDWREWTGELDVAVTRAARLADLIVLNRKLDGHVAPDMAAIAARVALKGRRPVVAVREDQVGFDVGGRALIAWDGSEPVANTLVAVTPLLAMAASVRLLVVETGAGDGSVEDAATYLSRHHVHAEIHVVNRGVTTIARQIAVQAQQWNADYLVMGAYGHRPVREHMFGGVTRDMLDDAMIPVILGH